MIELLNISANNLDRVNAFETVTFKLKKTISYLETMSNKRLCVCPEDIGEFIIKRKAEVRGSNNFPAKVITESLRLINTIEIHYYLILGEFLHSVSLNGLSSLDTNQQKLYLEQVRACNSFFKSTRSNIGYYSLYLEKWGNVRLEEILESLLERIQLAIEHRERRKGSIKPLYN